MSKNYGTNISFDEKGTTHFNHWQDCDSIIADNIQAQNTGEGTGSDDMKHAARIPMALLEKWKNEEGLDYHLVGQCPETTGKFWKKLQSPEWLYLRRWTGKVV
jgi:hypothetical protein